MVESFAAQASDTMVVDVAPSASEGGDAQPRARKKYLVARSHEQTNSIFDYVCVLHPAYCVVARAIWRPRWSRALVSVAKLTMRYLRRQALVVDAAAESALWAAD